MGKYEQVNLASLGLVSDELVATIEQAAGKLEQYIGKQTDTDLLQDCIKVIEQIGGTFQLVQLHGADLLAEEILSAARVVSTLEGDCNNEILSVLTSAFFILPRYLEYSQQTKRGMPVLLIDYINELRAVRKQPLMLESYFFDVDVSAAYKSKHRGLTIDEREFTALVKRLRHMYQVGLLSVLKGQQTRSALGIMSRALERLEVICGSRPLAKLWWVATAALEALRGDNMELTKSRKLLLSMVDRQLKQLQIQGMSYLGAVPVDAMIERFVFLTALAKNSTDRMDAVLSTYSVEALGYNDAQLRSERDALKGPSANTVSSVAAVLKDELRLAKEILEAAAQASEKGAVHDYDELIDTLTKVSEILSVVGLAAAGASLKEEVAKLEGYRDKNVAVESNVLIELADALLYVESSVSNMDKLNLSARGLDQANNTNRSEVIATAQLAEAELVVIAEAESGLALIKRALSSFVESDFDRGHVQNVSATLDSVRGGMIVLQLGRAAMVLASCSKFIQDTLVKSTNEVALQQLLETFADAIIALEYYLDAVKMDKKADDSVLGLAEESLEALGYRVGG